jgi:hypothetical protein
MPANPTRSRSTASKAGATPEQPSEADTPKVDAGEKPAQAVKAKETVAETASDLLAFETLKAKAMKGDSESIDFTIESYDEWLTTGGREIATVGYAKADDVISWAEGFAEDFIVPLMLACKKHGHPDWGRMGEAYKQAQKDLYKQANDAREKAGLPEMDEKRIGLLRNRVSFALSNTDIRDRAMAKWISDTRVGKGGRSFAELDYDQLKDDQEFRPLIVWEYDERTPTQVLTPDHWLDKPERERRTQARSAKAKRDRQDKAKQAVEAGLKSYLNEDSRKLAEGVTPTQALKALGLAVLAYGEGTVRAAKQPKGHSALVLEAIACLQGVLAHQNSDLSDEARKELIGHFDKLSVLVEKAK